MNTSKYIPYEIVSGIIFESNDFPEYPFLSGTGFFSYFPPYEHIFFITARHCVLDSISGVPIGNLKIPYTQASENNEIVPFLYFLETGCAKGVNEREDIVVYVVDDIPSDKKEVLMKRAIRLHHQDDADAILEDMIFSKDKIRVVGFPSVSKEIDYDIKQVTFQPRGFHADLVGDGPYRNWYSIENSSWKSENFDGFSGSPVLALCPSSVGEVIAIPIGIVLTKSYFLSVNVATNLIASYILECERPGNLS